MTSLAISVAAGTLLVGVAAALVVRRLRSLRLRLAGLALVATLAPMIGVLASGAVMFAAGHDLVLAATAAAASCASLVGAVLVARSILRPVQTLREAAEAMASGMLNARAEVEGPTELRMLAVEFNTMAMEIEALLDARRELVAWASHDLRTPLSAVSAMLEAVEDGVAEPERYLPRIRDQVRALAGIVDDLFELALLDAGAASFEVRDADVGDMIDHCLRGFEAAAAQSAIHLRHVVHQPCPAVRCAPDKVERILGNLVHNALRFAPAGGEVTVSAVPEQGSVRIIVDDDGPGFAPEDASRLFEAFWRADRSRGGRGAGLGLAIARGLVEAQGGRIDAEHRSPQGARLSFTLPAATIHAAPPEARLASP